MTNERLTPLLIEASEDAGDARPDLHGVALWWFCKRMTAAERAKAMMEYAKSQAMSGKESGQEKGS